METHPYPWPYDRDRRPLTGADLAVIVCGWQRSWVPLVDWSGADGHGTGPDAELERIGSLIADLRTTGATVVWVRHGAPDPPRRAAPTVLPLVGSLGWELLDGPAGGDVIVDVPGLDAYLVEWTDLALRARGIDRLVMCGLGTETAVSGTTRSANDRGAECLTAVDMVVHHDPLTGTAQLSSITMSGGIFGALGRGADLVTELRPTTIRPPTTTEEHP